MEKSDYDEGMCGKGASSEGIPDNTCTNRDTDLSIKPMHSCVNPDIKSSGALAGKGS